MNFYRPDTLSDLLNFIENVKENRFFLAGGTDINIMKKNDLFENENVIIFINHLDELKGIHEKSDYIVIGSATTFSEILNSKMISKFLPFFQLSLRSFASPLIQTIATIGGNIANASPTADSIPLLLVLDAKLEIISSNKTRLVNLSNFYTGYKKFNLEKNEIIKSVLIPKFAEKNSIKFYNINNMPLFITGLCILGIAVWLIVEAIILFIKRYQKRQFKE